MSDNYLRLFPTDRTWLPTSEQADRAVATLRVLAPSAQEIAAEVYGMVTFIDQGANLERIGCPACHAELDLEWWSEQMARRDEHDFVTLDVEAPCCGAATTLDDLVYDWPAGFASVELSVLNPDRSWLSADELNTVAAAVGHPLRQVMAHY
ncbi:hypothetical protein [Cellulomonas sp.]|uniref:hypothetical protein n=1 Tax=Cellulomonas sp. TaxID=40001 RepID=UPI001B0C4753|nr:hypothetical protein [Cellulomonas sp.]MBO9553179.1 hypothetical protein [Cellulomonas sp.]